MNSKNISMLILINGLLIACGGGGGGGEDSDITPLDPAPIGNVAPTVNAGANKSVISGDAVSLVSTAADSDGTIASYSWQSSDSSLAITGGNTQTVEFTAPTVSDLTSVTFTLTVTDDRGAIASDRVVVTIAPLLPSVTQTVFVSPAGSDTNSGASMNAALLTFQAAADVAQTSGLGAVVEFADGEYVFDQTVVLDASYSGITFQAATGAKPVFTSLVKVSGWSSYSGDIMVADLPAGISHVRYLQDKSENWMERSASAQFTTTETAAESGCLECNNYDPSAQASMTNMLYSGQTPVDWSRANQYDLKVSTLAWHQDVLPIASFGGGRINTATPGLYELRKDFEEFVPAAWVMNTIEGIDTAGEWASLDGRIYLHPSSGTNDIYVPMLTELIRLDDGTIDGNAEVATPVANITFDGITFTGGDYRVIQSDDITTGHDWMVVDEPDALLRIRNAQNITIRNSTFFKSGGTGIRADRHAQNIVITNNKLAYLGRNGIGLVGRGPGYGDVNRDNEIAYNTLEYIGMEHWAAVAIVLDQSSNNRVHHNYLANTYFTGIAVIGPRQLAIAAKVEGADSFYSGREFHYFEWAPSVVQFAIDNGGILLGSQEAMRFVYNYNNRIEENALIDVSTGQRLFVNGQIYVSGAQRSTSASDIKTNYIERNYLYDSGNHSNNDYAIYSDSDQDDCNYIGNMISGVRNGDTQPEGLPIIVAFAQWAETENEGLGRITLQANVIENSTFCEECTHLIGGNFIEVGQVVNGAGGESQYIDNYQQMFGTLCDGNLPQVVTLPGIDTMRSRLQVVIEENGGTATCASM